MKFTQVWGIPWGAPGENHEINDESPLWYFRQLTHWNFLDRNSEVFFQNVKGHPAHIADERCSKILGLGQMSKTTAWHIFQSSWTTGSSCSASCCLVDGFTHAVGQWRFKTLLSFSETMEATRNEMVLKTGEWTRKQIHYADNRET